MFLLFAAAGEGESGHGGHHEPIIVQFVNHYLGEPVHHFQMQYTRPLWTRLLANFGTTPEALFGEYTAENAIPWYTIMFIVACILTATVVWILKGKLSEDEPSGGQLTLEAGVLAIRDMLVSVVGPQGVKYFPVVATFAILILISNLMGLFPLFMAPTAATSVTFALGISSFVYYNYIGIRENGIGNHLAHWAGPIWWMAPLIFPIELIGNFIRPMSLGIRLFGNMYADEQVAATIANLANILHLPAFVTQLGVPVLLMPLALFVALIQAFVFTLLSMVYLSEVSHSHEEHEHAEHTHHREPHIETETVAAPA
jgi:F-type H+-transporting ATPase subunit a